MTGPQGAGTFSSFVSVAVGPPPFSEYDNLLIDEMGVMWYSALAFEDLENNATPMGGSHTIVGSDRRIWLTVAGEPFWTGIVGDNVLPVVAAAIGGGGGGGHNSSTREYGGGGGGGGLDEFIGDYSGDGFIPSFGSGGTAGTVGGNGGNGGTTTVTELGLSAAGGGGR